MARYAGGAALLVLTVTAAVGPAAAQPAVLGNRLGEYSPSPGGFTNRLGGAERSQAGSEVPHAAPAGVQPQPQPHAAAPTRVPGDH